MSTTYVPMSDAGRMAFETVQTTRDILRDWNMPQWEVRLFDGFHGWGAQTEHVMHILVWSVPYMLLNPGHTWNTMAHELAHVATGSGMRRPSRNAHDDVWREAFLALGGNGLERSQNVILPEYADGAMHTNYEMLTHL
jgi:hypothetical protein